MVRYLLPFMRGIQGIPFGERIMPNYIFADRNKKGTSTIEYTTELRGDKWWYCRSVVIQIPGSTSEHHTQWFGGYDNEKECVQRIDHAKTLDKEFLSIT